LDDQLTFSFGIVAKTVRKLTFLGRNVAGTVRKVTFSGKKINKKLKLLTSPAENVTNCANWTVFNLRMFHQTGSV